MHPESGFGLLQTDHKLKKMTMTSQVFDMTSLLTFLQVLQFFLLSLVTGPSFMSISSLVLDNLLL